MSLLSRGGGRTRASRQRTAAGSAVRRPAGERPLAAISATREAKKARPDTARKGAMRTGRSPRCAPKATQAEGTAPQPARAAARLPAVIPGGCGARGLPGEASSCPAERVTGDGPQDLGSRQERAREGAAHLAPADPGPVI